MQKLKFWKIESVTKVACTVSRACNYACGIMLVGIFLQATTAKSLFHGNEESYLVLSFSGLMLSVLMEMGSGSKGQLQASLFIFLAPLVLSLIEVVAWNPSPLAYLGVGIMAITWHLNGVQLGKLINGKSATGSL